jgi:hypothetical protein
MEFSDHDEMAIRLKRRKRRQSSDVFWNLLSVCLALATVAMIAVMLMIFSNPSVSFNPFPPPTMPVLAVYPTATPTLVMMPATWTPKALITKPPVPTNTPTPVVITATPEPTQIAATDTPTIQVTTDQSYTFSLQGNPTGVRSTLFKPETGCTWQGVAGLVVDMQGRPVIGRAIVLNGMYGGKTINSQQTISGTHTEYGDSGYEFQLGTTPIASSGLLSIQMVDQAGLPLSAPVIFDTYGTCDQNLVLINFKQIK